PPVRYGDRLPVRRDLFRQLSASSGMVGRLSTLGLILSQDICFLSIVFVAFGSGGSVLSRASFSLWTFGDFGISVEVLLCRRCVNSLLSAAAVLTTGSCFRWNTPVRASVGDFPVGEDQWLLDLWARVPHTLTW
ncbi:unnamed protein product, partial [Brassica oleracea]